MANKRSSRRSRSGFTILELILYILIFAIVATLGTSIFNFAVKAKVYVGGLNESGTAATQAMARMVATVHQATGIVGASSTLSLAMSSSSINPTIFSLSGGAIMMKQGSGAASAITPSTVTVSALTFTPLYNANPSTSSVQIVLTAGYNKNGAIDPTTIYSIQTTAFPL